MSHAERLEFVRGMALTWQACWDLPLPSPRQIGELIATDNNSSISLTVGPDRHYSLGGPFTSVREWLRARLQHAVTSLQRASGIDDYKEECMASIQAVVDNRLNQISQTVEEYPIVALTVDMGLHNVLVAADDHTEINAIIDWELFRMGASNGFGVEYPQADQLRSAFWDGRVIGRVRVQRTLWNGFDLLVFMQPEYCSNKIPKAEKWEFWAENKRVVKAMLKKYGVEES